jgi:hypothetical protein
VQLLGIGAEPNARLVHTELAYVAAKNRLELVLLARLEPREWVECRHRVIVIVHRCG